MKRILLVCSIILFSQTTLLVMAQAENFPAVPGGATEPPKVTSPADKQRIFYGYVPPAPIRHTWPGGYRVIFSELTNTLIEHVLGQY
jgi:hypothetical protein